MTIGDVLYTLIIKPLELIFELIFAASYDIIPNPAVNIVIVSLAINLLVLPLYRRADIIQAEAKAKENAIRPMVEHIKKHFKGDEKVMMLQTYYDQKNYHPLSSMKSIISLLLQIPFFIAAYQFLSHLTLLSGHSMGPIKDLSQPDGLIVTGSLTINLLPILMTVINIVSSEIYTKGQPFKDKIVLYVTALVFLVLLYNSPSGLVFYWTLNNVFSLVKNTFFKLKNPGLVFKIICMVSGALIAVFTVINREALSGDNITVLAALSIGFILPLALHKVKFKKAKEISKADTAMFWLGTVYMAILTGIYIPARVINSSPEDFLDSIHVLNPNHYVLYTSLVAAGFFVLWVGVFYLLGSPETRKAFAIVMFIASAVSTVNFMVFGIDSNGMISAELSMPYWIEPDWSLKMITLLSAVIIAVIIIIISRITVKPFPVILIAGSVSLLVISTMKIGQIQDEYRDYLRLLSSNDKPDIVLSKNGKNVVVLMLDRAIGSLVPYIFNEQDLYSSYDGFTFYPNTISHGIATNLASPELYGGYEYTAEAMNARDDQLLMEKHNEAIRVLPLLFSSNGYDAVTVDPPYANYRELSDLTLFDEYENIHAYRAHGQYNPYGESAFHQLNYVRERNFFCYSIYKISLSMFKGFLYDGGNYHELERNDLFTDSEYSFPQKHETISKTTGLDSMFMDSYTALEAMPSYTSIVEDSSDNFVMCCNNTPHCFMIMQEPEYSIAQEVDNTEYDLAHSDRFTLDGRTMNVTNNVQMEMYHVDTASYLSLSRWFDYLKENGVWDNTRIIIVADHGFMCQHFDDMILYEYAFDTEYANPVLMVKDFDSHGFTTSDEFMTNADVPTLAMQGIIKDPVNPFTGKLITNDAKFSGPQKVLESYNWWPSRNNGTKFEAGKWYSVHDNIFDKNNWEYLGEY